MRWYLGRGRRHDRLKREWIITSRCSTGSDLWMSNKNHPPRVEAEHIGIHARRGDRRRRSEPTGSTPGRRVSSTIWSRIQIVQALPPSTPYETGGWPSFGPVVAGYASWRSPT
jgi:hypothetical protein